MAKVKPGKFAGFSASQNQRLAEPPSSGTVFCHGLLGAVLLGHQDQVRGAELKGFAVNGSLRGLCCKVHLAEQPPDFSSGVDALRRRPRINPAVANERVVDVEPAFGGKVAAIGG